MNTKPCLHWTVESDKTLHTIRFNTVSQKGSRHFSCNLTKHCLSFNHGLCSNTSHVLMTTGFVNGKWQFSTHYRTDAPQPSQKNFQGDYVGNTYSCAKFGAYPSTGCFRANRWNRTKKILIYTSFWEFTYSSDPSMDFHTWWLKWRRLTQGCAFLGLIDTAPYLGVKSAKTQIMGGWIGIFKPNLQSQKTCILSKLLHRIQPNFAQW